MTQLLVDGKPMDYSYLPEHMQDGARNYFERQIPPGGFLTAVLTNDLRGAIERADHINIDRLVDWVQWLTWHAPRGSWGSPDAFKQWLTKEPS